MVNQHLELGLFVKKVVNVDQRCVLAATAVVLNQMGAQAMVYATN